MICLIRFIESFFINTLPYVVGATLLFSCFMPLKQWVKRIPLVIVLISTAILFAITETVAWEVPNGPTLVLINLTQIIGISLVIQHFFQGKWYRKALSIFTMFTLIAVTELLLVIVLNINWSQGGTISVNGSGSSVLMTLAIVTGIKLWRKQRGVSMSRGLSLLQILLVSICMLGAGVLSVSSVMGGMIEWPETIAITAFMILMVLCYVNFEITDTIYRRNQELKLQEQRHQMMEEYYNRVEAHQTEIRIMKHDLKNQLIALNAHADNSLIDDFIERFSTQTKYDFTTHTGMNALLGAKMQQAEADNIICEFEASLPADVLIEETDLAALCGNILDNALEACRLSTDKRYIRFRCIYHNGSLVIESENSTDGAAKDLQTRKLDKANHGLGMNSIKSIVEKYGGQMQYEFSSHHFFINLTVFEKL